MNPPHGYVRQRPDHQSHNYFFSFFFPVKLYFFFGNRTKIQAEAVKNLLGSLNLAAKGNSK